MARRLLGLGMAAGMIAAGTGLGYQVRWLTDDPAVDTATGAVTRFDITSLVSDTDRLRPGGFVSANVTINNWHHRAPVRVTSLAATRIDVDPPHAAAGCSGAHYAFTGPPVLPRLAGYQWWKWESTEYYATVTGTVTMSPTAPTVCLGAGVSLRLRADGQILPSSHGERA